MKILGIDATRNKAVVLDGESCVCSHIDEEVDLVVSNADIQLTNGTQVLYYNNRGVIEQAASFLLEKGYVDCDIDPEYHCALYLAWMGRRWVKNQARNQNEHAGNGLREK